MQWTIKSGDCGFDCHWGQIFFLCLVRSDCHWRKWVDLFRCKVDFRFPRPACRISTSALFLGGKVENSVWSLRTCTFSTDILSLFLSLGCEFIFDELNLKQERTVQKVKAAHRHGLILATFTRISSSLD